MGFWFRKVADEGRAFGYAPMPRRVSTQDPLTAHDVRNVVSNVSLLAGQLADAADERTRDIGDRLVRASDRLIEMTVSTARAQSEPDDTTLVRVIEDVENLVATIAPGEVDMIFNCWDDVDLHEHGTAVFRIVSNLCLNAVCAMQRHGGGELHVFSTSDDQTVDIFVVDDGPGLWSANDLGSLGNPQTARPRSASGSGLGMLICVQLAAEIGAELDLVQTGNTGTCFRLRLRANKPMQLVA